MHSGERREAIYSALVTFIRKFSSALAIFAVSNAIGWAGYVPPVQQTIDGATKLIEQPQTDTFLLVLRLIFMLLPIVLLAFALIFALRFPLDPRPASPPQRHASPVSAPTNRWMNPKSAN